MTTLVILGADLEGSSNLDDLADVGGGLTGGFAGNEPSVPPAADVSEDFGAGVGGGTPPVTRSEHIPRPWRWFK